MLYSWFTAQRILWVWKFYSKSYNIIYIGTSSGNHEFMLTQLFSDSGVLSSFNQANSERPQVIRHNDLDEIHRSQLPQGYSGRDCQQSAKQESNQPQNQHVRLRGSARLTDPRMVAGCHPCIASSSGTDCEVLMPIDLYQLQPITVRIGK